MMSGAETGSHVVFSQEQNLQRKMPVCFINTNPGPSAQEDFSVLKSEAWRYVQKRQETQPWVTFKPSSTWTKIPPKVPVSAGINVRDVFFPPSVYTRFMFSKRSVHLPLLICWGDWPETSDGSERLSGERERGARNCSWEWSEVREWISEISVKKESKV